MNEKTEDRKTKTPEQQRWEEESAIMHLQKANARLVKLNAIAWLIVGLMVGLLAYVVFGFNVSTESVAIDSHQGTANYIGNDGDIINGRD